MNTSAGRLYVCDVDEGDLRPLLLASVEMGPGDVVILLCFLPLAHQVARAASMIAAKGCEIRLVPGTGDTGDDLMASGSPWAFPRSLHGQVEILGELRVAGLGGGAPPPAGGDEPRSRALSFAEVAWRAGAEKLSGKRADVLISYAAPSTAPDASDVVGSLAAAMRCRWIVHSSLERGYEDVLPNGIRVRGLSTGEIWRLPDAEL